ncbi:CDGSH iron-sulfur domain-containing protein 3, mitochondrial [Rhinophrynus dorsalis]
MQNTGVDSGTQAVQAKINLHPASQGPLPPAAKWAHRGKASPVNEGSCNQQRSLYEMKSIWGIRFIVIRACTTSQSTPIIAAKHPYQVEVKAGKTYPWCSCGHSKKQPFCDGSHRKATSGLSPLRFTPTQDKVVWLCGCKQTKTPPYCDGTHKGDVVQSSALGHRP